VLHDTTLIATIAVGIALAYLLGLAATRVRLPPLVGYLLAGVLTGPFTPGYVADVGLAQQLSEIGVILLMFGVGMHFSVADLLAVRRIAVPGAVGQIAVATVLGAALCRFGWGWPWSQGLVFGMCLSVASTVVLLRALEDRGQLDTTDGRIAVGWLVVEDLVTVLVLVLLPTFQRALAGDGGGDVLATVAATVGKVVAFVALMLVVGRRAVPWLLQKTARTGSRELFTLAVLAVALGTAFGASALFGVSFALGAFFAGMVVNGSDLSHEAARDSLPLQDAFSVLFFVAVGMLFDPGILVRQPLEVAAVVLIVMVGKSLAAFLIVLAFRHSIATALAISASLAQIGEFSFILAALAAALGLLPVEGQSLIVAGALISISLNPLSFAAAVRLGDWIRSRPRLLELLERQDVHAPTPAPSAPTQELIGHAVIVGFGRVGSAVGETLAARSIPYVVVEQDRATVAALRARGLTVVHGDATRRDVLGQAHVQSAKLLVAAAPDPYQVRAVIELARTLNQAIETVARTHSESERAYLEKHGVGLALHGERELALGLAHYSLMRMGCSDDQADEAIAEVRSRERTVPSPGVRATS
jgi:CPA2 family monovalent cation:H+ antiporter-2